jgi:hypothetical protein
LRRALAIAARRGFADIVALLLADPRVDPAGSEVLREAAKRGHVAVVALLLADARFDPSADDDMTLLHACSQGAGAVVKCLLADSRVNPAARDGRPLGIAISAGAGSVVAALLADARVTAHLAASPRIRDELLRAAENINDEDVLPQLRQSPLFAPAVAAAIGGSDAARERGAVAGSDAAVCRSLAEPSADAADALRAAQLEARAAKQDALRRALTGNAWDAARGLLSDGSLDLDPTIDDNALLKSAVERLDFALLNALSAHPRIDAAAAAAARVRAEAALAEAVSILDFARAGTTSEREVYRL